MGLGVKFKNINSSDETSIVELSPLINCDEHRIMQVLLCLISNALKFTQEGEVQIEVEIVENTTEKKYLKGRAEADDGGFHDLVVAVRSRNIDPDELCIAGLFQNVNAARKPLKLVSPGLRTLTMNKITQTGIIPANSRKINLFSINISTKNRWQKENCRFQLYCLESVFGC